MSYDILQSSTESVLLFLMIQSSDHITGLTGASPTVTLSKNGGSFGSPSGAVSEIANGWYKVAANATDTNTLGPLALHATATSGDPCDIVVANIVAYDPQVGTNLGLSALPTANPGAANGLPICGANAAIKFTGTAASGATPATSGMTLIGGAADTTGGGTAAPGLSSTGGAGAASTNGAAAGVTWTAGGTTTVSGNDGAIFTATGNGNGATLAHAGTGKDFNAQTTNALQVNATAINAISTGSVTTVSAVIGTTHAITFDANNLPEVDVEDWKGTAVGSPATGGIPDVNVKNINNVSASSVTTVNANQGTTQPVNFTGTAGSALVKGDAIDINSVSASSVTTINANLGTSQPVNFTGTAGSALVKGDAIDINSVAASAVTTINANIGTTQPINFTGTGGSTLVKSDVTDWGTTAVGSIPPDATFIRSGTAQAGGATSITLDAGASATNNLYQNEVIFIRSGTGAGQTNIITGYVGSTKIATVGNTWATNPDSSSVFTIWAVGPGTASVSGTVNANVTEWNGASVAVPNVSGVPIVDVGYFKGTVSAGAAGYAGIDWAHIAGTTTVVDLSNTTIAGVDAAGQNALADAFLNRDMSAGTDSGSPTFRTPRQAFRVLRNKLDTSSGTTVTVYKEDDATVSWTGTLTGNTNATPIVTVDPAGP